MIKEGISYSKNWHNMELCLRQHYGQDIFNSWFSKLKLLNFSGNTITLTCPTNFVRDWIQSNYLSSMIDLIVKIDSEVKYVELLTRKDTLEELDGQKDLVVNAIPEDQDDFSCKLDKRFTFSNFVIGKPNELAYSAALAVAESKEVIIPSNPLFLYGGVGLGKTHLMHATKAYIAQHNPSRKVIYISAEKFMYYFIKALRNKDIMTFKEKLRSIDVLMIDDIQFISGKESTQEEFFHTLNELINNQKQVVISCDRSPSDLEDIEERIKSRLGWGLVADIHSTTYELRIGILQSKLDNMSIDIPSEVLDFLATKITNNIRELEGALNKVVAHSTLIGRKITIDSTQDILKDLIRHNEKNVTIDLVIKKVCHHYKIKLIDLLSSRRSSNIVIPRQVAMYIAKELTNKSFLDIARAFRKKDHTTVIHAVKKIKDLYNLDSTMREDIDLLIRHIDY